MENSPLNLAHCNERKAEKHILHRRYDEAIQCLEKSLSFISEAYKTIAMPIGVQVLDVQASEYKRKIALINIRKLQERKNEDSGEKVKKVISRSPSNTFGNEAISPDLNLVKEIKDIDRAHNTDIDWLQDTDMRDVPSLAPLELPSLDFHMLEAGNTDSIQSVMSNISLYKKDVDDDT